MIPLPDFSKSFDHENNFYLSCANARLGKFLAHYELFKMVKDLPGALVECGVFKGASFVRFAAFREFFDGSRDRPLVGFDTFGTFPNTGFEADQRHRENFVKAAGERSISTGQLLEVLKNKNSDKNIELIEGDITATVPDYVKKNPKLTISLLNLDTDIYEPAVTILENFWPRIVQGGVLILDDYQVFPGETKAVDDYFKGRNIQIKKFPFAATPSYIIKE